MKTKHILWISIIAFSILSFMGGCSKYNSLVTKEETVSAAWSQVENVYQRRADLIPNLVKTVKGYAAHEKTTFTEVTEARANATKITIDLNTATAAQLQEYSAAQTQLTSSLSKLLAVVEAYPELKADKNFLALQSQLEGTENRIAVERKRFNEAAKAYNIYIRRFPNNIIAGLLGFEKKVYFEADKDAKKVPEVDF
ncbi:MAG: LemA family protein [Candidatus Absconditabacterales bacterium]|jgi:LemA protein